MITKRNDKTKQTKKKKKKKNPKSFVSIAQIFLASSFIYLINASNFFFQHVLQILQFTFFKSFFNFKT